MGFGINFKKNIIGATKEILVCSKTTLSGESRFHISPPRGFEPESLVAGSKQVVHWTSEIW
jgi:hypothetical protein